MSIIKLNVENCQNCFKCIRECPLKAIEFKDSRTKIIEDECVLCGTCMEICPRGAKYVRHNVKRVKELLASGKPVCVTVAPSWVGWYNSGDFPAGMNPAFPTGKYPNFPTGKYPNFPTGKYPNFPVYSAALKKLGFARVEETAIGAACVSKEYAKLMEQGQMKNIIATACSSVVMLIERHFPQLLNNLAPVSSPMMAHARLMREAYGDIKVVFVGPCLSKMHEAEDALAGGMVDEVLTFEDIDTWLAEEGIRIEDEDSEAAGVREPVARIYPKQEGIIRTIDAFHGYTPVSVDGIDRCIEMFTSMLNEETEHIFVEANICAGSCIGGPIMRMHHKNIIRSTARLKTEPEPADGVPAPTADMEFPHPRVFANRSVEMRMPSDGQIREILAKIGKTLPEQELNCGSCGYATCRDKAIAVFNGKADVTMCLPFLREQAENKSSMVIENSPNGIITFDEEMNVMEINPKAETLFGVTRGTILGEMIPALYGETAFDDARENRETVIKKIDGATEEIKVELSVVYLEKNKMFIAFAKDISEEESNRAELATLRMSTVDTAQQVIEKQMRVAQEIASLLGETTAETKVALTKLKKSITDLD